MSWMDDGNDSGYPSDEELQKLDIDYELDKLGYQTESNKRYKPSKSLNNETKKTLLKKRKRKNYN